jgi:hypothetical protein
MSPLRPSSAQSSLGMRDTLGWRDVNHYEALKQRVHSLKQEHQKVIKTNQAAEEVGCTGAEEAQVWHGSRGWFS